MGYTITREDLIRDLYIAFYDARKHKTTKSYVLEFEGNLKEEIEKLCDELLTRTYKPLPSTCFIVNYPKKREIFAAQFRDRIIHHLYYNYTSELFERTFIQDAYSCIKGRGTHYGISRLQSHIRKESLNYSVPCYVMKLDIRGYFMNINRKILLRIANDTIVKMSTHRLSKHGIKTWSDILDIDFILWLTKVIVLINPIEDCEVICNVNQWTGLDKNKSLFCVSEGCGLPIGNLTSQLFSNVYLNALDQYIKRVLGCKHYGRYVDDAYIVSTDREWMLSIVPLIRKFLKDELGLDLHMGKLRIDDVNYGVEFLGGFVKRYRNYVSRHTVKRMMVKLKDKDKGEYEYSDMYCTINSYLGMLGHYSSYKIRQDIFMKDEYLKISSYDCEMSKMHKIAC